MAISCGTDIISVNRIKKSINELGDNFLKKIYTNNEINYCESKRMSKFQSYAARFAAKEAIYKAISPEIDEEGISWHDAEVINAENGKPKLILHGTLEKLINQNGVSQENIDISLSHDNDYAIAMVVINKNEIERK